MPSKNWSMNGSMMPMSAPPSPVVGVSPSGSGRSVYAPEFTCDPQARVSTGSPMLRPSPSEVVRVVHQMLPMTMPGSLPNTPSLAPASPEGLIVGAPMGGNGSVAGTPHLSYLTAGPVGASLGSGTPIGFVTTVSRQSDNVAPGGGRGRTGRTTRQV